MSTGAALGVGIGLSLLGGVYQGQAAEDSAEYNMAQAEQDVKLLQVQEGQAMASTRRQGAADIGAIEAAQAVSGIQMGTGSALDAIRFQAEQNSRNEFNLLMESQVAQQNRLAGGELGLIEASNASMGAMMGAGGQAISTVASYRATKRN